MNWLFDTLTSWVHHSCPVHSRIRCGCLAVAIALCFGLLQGGSATAKQVLVDLDPRATFLRTNRDDALDSIPLELAGFGASPQDVLYIQRLGGFSFRSTLPDNSSSDTIGIFSSTPTLRSPRFTSRVEDAIDAGVDFDSLPTFFDGIGTNIAEDFLIAGTSPDEPDGVLITVPEGATHLFVAAHDSLYRDNVDSNSDYKVLITVVPEPCALWLACLGITTAPSYSRLIRSAQ